MKIREIDGTLALEIASKLVDEKAENRLHCTPAVKPIIEVNQENGKKNFCQVNSVQLEVVDGVLVGNIDAKVIDFLSVAKIDIRNI